MKFGVQSNYRMMLRKGLLCLCAISISGCTSLTPKQAIPEKFVDQTKELARLKLPSSYVIGNTALEQKQIDEVALLKWWAKFEDPLLNSYVERAVAESQDIVIALARLDQVRASSARATADLSPTIDLGGSATEQRRSLEDPIVRGNVNSPGFTRSITTLRNDANVAWEIDFFNRKGAQRNAAQARQQESEFDHQAIRLTVVSDVARKVLSARTSQARLLIAKQNVLVEEESIAIAKARIRGGQATEVDLRRAIAAQQDALVRQAALDADLSNTAQELAILLAVAPSQIKTQLADSRLKPPMSVAVQSTLVDAPSELLKRRPDLLRAEMKLLAVSEDLAATTAERFPKVSLGSTLALIASSVSNLTTGRAIFASLAPSITWRAFDGGRLEADMQRATAVQREAALAYQLSAMTAFAEVEGSIATMTDRTTALSHAEQSLEANKAILQINTLQYEKRFGEYSTVLDAKRTVNSSTDAILNNRLSLQLAQVTAFKVLGGGW
jgi:NodT family efflux transporter outer membrane factor (OMF) lipoprotein